MRLLIALLFLAAPVQADLTAQGKYLIQRSRVDYASTSVSTSAWTQIVASMPFDATEIEIFDSSGQTLQMSFGAVGAEGSNTKLYIFPGGNGRVPLKVPAGTRISIKAVSALADKGEGDINFYQ